MYEESLCCAGSLKLVTVGAPRSAGPESVLEHALFLMQHGRLFAAWADPGWSGGSFRADVAQVLALPAGPQLMAALAGLAGLGGGRCPARHGPGHGIGIHGAPRYGAPGNPCLCLLAVAAAWQACAGYASAAARGAVVDAVGASPVVLPRVGARPSLADPAREEVAVALRLSPGSAGTRIDQSRDLAALPDLIDLVREGLLCDGSASRIAAGLSRLTPQDAAHCARELARRLRQRLQQGKRAWTGSDAADCARRLAVRCGSYRAAAKKAVARRAVARWSNGDGTATLQALLPDLAAERVFRRLTSIAAGLADDGRSMDARRADVLTDLVLGSQTSRATGVELNIIISADALRGADGATAEVPGFGPIPAAQAQELAANADWSAWIRDAAGAITATGTRRYRPGAALARLVRAREPWCRMPGCRRPALQCDIDHAIAYPAGSTAPENLGPLCRRHHNLKTHAGWQLDAADPDQQLWTTPAGATVMDAPEPPWMDGC